MQRQREELLNNKWPNMNEEVALRKLLTSNKVRELRNLGTLAYKSKCKCEKQLKNTELGWGGGGAVSKNEIVHSKRNTEQELTSRINVW
jgi:hypothetical protein